MTANRTVANSGTLTGSAFATDVKEEVEKLWAWGVSPLINVTGSNAIVAECPVPILAYAVGLKISFQVAVTNTGGVTINAGPGAVSLLSNAGQALVAGNLVAGTRIMAEYTGSAFIILAGMSMPASTLVSFAHFAYAVTSGTVTVVNAVRTAYPLNREVRNTISGASLNTSTGVVSIPAGSYRWRAYGQKWDSGNGLNFHLRNITDGVDFPGARLQTGYWSEGGGSFDIDEQTSIRVEYYGSGGWLASPHVSEPGFEDHYGGLELMKVG